MYGTQKNTDFSPHEAEMAFNKNVFRYSVILITIVAIISIVGYIFIKQSNGIFAIDTQLFENSTEPMMLTYDTNGLVGTDELKVGVSGCIIGDDYVTVNIYGHNYSNAQWSPEGNTFVLSSFNATTPETRYHYYSDDRQDMTVQASSPFTYTTTFSINNAREKLDKGYIFCLSAFRSANSPTLEIILTDITLDESV